MVQRQPKGPDVKLSRRQVTGRAGQGDRETAGRSGSLGAWRERRALPLLMAVPTVALLAVGVIRIRSSAQDMTVYQQVQHLAETSNSVAGLAQALEVERTETARFVVLGLNGGRGASPRSFTGPQLEEATLQAAYRTTDKLAGQVRRQAGAIGGAYPAPVRAQAREVITAIAGLGSLRHAATATDLNGLAVEQEYTSVITDVLGFGPHIALPGSGAGVAQTVRVLDLISRMKAEESSQAAILTSGLSSDLFSQGYFGPAQLTAITGSIAAQNTDAAEFGAHATAAQARQYHSVLSEAPVERASTDEATAVALASSRGAPVGPTAADASMGLNYQFSGLRGLEEKLSSSVISQADSRRGAAEASVVIFSALLAALVLLMAFIFLPPAFRRRRRPAG